MEQSRDSNIIRSVLTASKILFKIAELNTEVTPTELANHMNIDKVKAYRYLNSLKQGGLLYYQDGKYGLSIGTLSLAKSFLENNQALIRLIEPFMIKLSNLTGQTVLLHIWDDREVVVANRVYSQQPTYHIQSEVGTRHVPFNIAGGMVLLAHMPPSTIASVLDSLEPGQKKRILSDLEQIRKNGYYVLHDSIVKGITGISAPLVTYGGKVIAAITLIGTTESLQQFGLDLHIKLLLNTIKQLSEGCADAPPIKNSGNG